jgi:hypothetical protein
LVHEAAESCAGVGGHGGLFTAEDAEEDGKQIDTEGTESSRGIGFMAVIVTAVVAR